MNKKNILDCFGWHADSVEFITDYGINPKFGIHMTGYCKSGTTFVYESPSQVKDKIESRMNGREGEKEKMNDRFEKEFKGSINVSPEALRRTMYNTMYGANPQHVNCRAFIIPEIKDVVFNPPATIVFWTDNTKTVVKCQNDEEFDPEKGITMAFFKKMHGNKGHYFEEIKKWCEKYYEQEEQTNQFMDEINSIRERILSGTTNQLMDEINSIRESILSGTTKGDDN